MGIFSKAFRPKALAPTDDAYYYPGGNYYGGYGLSETGMMVGSESAMRQITVYNCIKVLYNCVSQMPCQLMQDIDGVKSKAKDHYLYKVIGKKPNGWMTAPQIWGQAIVHVSLRGNFYAFKMGIGNKVLQLLPIHPDRVTVVQNKDWSLTYKVAGSELKEYSQSEILHIRGMSLDGFTGMNPIEYARECIGLGLASNRFLARWFGKGMHPGAIIKQKDWLDPITHANKWKAYCIKYGGLNNSQDLMLLDGDSTIEFPPIKLVDAQFLEQMRLNESQICGMFGVPLILVQAGENPATYASSTEFKRNFVDMTISPIAVNFETSIDRDCLTDKEQETLYTKYNLNSLYRGNLVERFASYKEGINAEFMSPNEARALEDWNPYKGGDEYRTRTSTIKESDKVKQTDNKSPNEEDQ